MNYTELTQAIKDYLQETETTFVGQIPTFVQQAEERIYRSVKIPDLMKTATGTMTASDQYLSKPSDLLNVQSISYGATSQTFLGFKDRSFMREAYPNAATTGAPLHYSNFDDDFWVIAPTPDSNYAVTVTYYYDPISIVDAGTSWLGDNGSSLLLYGSLVEAYTFLKGDADLIDLYAQRYDDAMRNMVELGLIKSMRDDYREREIRVKK